MLHSYFTIAFRNLLKQKVFSLINILGLTIGITCCILLTLYIRDEFSYERHFDDYRSIYRLTSVFTAEKWSSKLPSSAPPAVPALLQEFPEIQAATRVATPPDVQRHYIRFHDKGFYEDNGYLVDSAFFDVFSYAFAEGDRATALDGPSAVVLSHAVARKFFGDASALDQLLIINSGNLTDTFRVTGVLKPYTHPSQLDAGLYMTMNSKGWGNIIGNTNDWSQTYIYSFIKLKPGAVAEDLVAKFPAMVEKYDVKGISTEIGYKNVLGLQPLKDMHLYSAREFSADSSIKEIGTGGNITSVYIIGSICIFILLLACINFMNLTTAKAFQRAGEVGVRKSLGANRSALIWQFMGESLTIVALAMILSLGLAQITLPLFNAFAQKDLAINTQNIGYVLVALVSVSLLTGIVAGSYPAFFLSAFKPARVLKEKHFTGNSSNWLRKGLVVFQFVVSVTLIASIFVIRKQVSFMQRKPLGFNAEYKITIPLQTDEAKAAYLNLKDRYLQLSGVADVSAASALPATATIRGIPLHPDGSTVESAQYHHWISIDENYFKMLGIRFLAGRDLNAVTDAAAFGTPLTHVVVNRASLSNNGIELKDAIGSKLHVQLNGMNLAFQIEGVVEDFHQLFMHRKLSPMIFMIPSPRTDYTGLCVAVNAADYKETLAALEKLWKEIVPNTVFEHSTLTDNVKKQYEADQRVFAVITMFTIIAIAISCLGLYGLSIYMAERRVKEIGIRKVLGASVSSIVSMLSLDFIKLVAIAFVLAVPIGYYAMNRWLENFAYKIELDVVVFVLAGIASFGIAWLTIGFEAVKAATGNPVDSLRSE
jgi:putative ABC transport system permease protein